MQRECIYNALSQGCQLEFHRRHRRLGRRSWGGLCLLLLSQFVGAEVRIEPSVASTAETAELVRIVQDAITGGPPEVAGLDARVTLGLAALEQALASDDGRPIVAAYVTSTEFGAAISGRNRAHVAAVFSNPDPRDQVRLARALLGRSALGAFDSAATHPLVQLLGDSVHAIPASGEQRIDSLLRGAEAFDAVVVLPDPTLLNRSNINHVVRTLYGRRKVLIGYSVTLTRVGALASVYVSPEAIARGVVDVLSRYAANRTMPPPVFVSDIDVIVNDRLARSLNIAVPEHADLLDAVRSRRSEGAP
jgi:hypothetical protein